MDYLFSKTENKIKKCEDICLTYHTQCMISLTLLSLLLRSKFFFEFKWKYRTNNNNRPMTFVQKALFQAIFHHGVDDPLCNWVPQGM